MLARSVVAHKSVGCMGSGNKYDVMRGLDPRMTGREVEIAFYLAFSRFAAQAGPGPRM
jgi:hypothetical protein